MLEEMNTYFHKKYDKEFSEVILQVIYRTIKEYLKIKQKKKARYMVHYAFCHYKLDFFTKIRFLSKMCIHKKNK